LTLRLGEKSWQFMLEAQGKKTQGAQTFSSFEICS
jgi:hypothetical protein